MKLNARWARIDIVNDGLMDKNHLLVIPFNSHSLLLPQRWGNFYPLRKKDLKYWNTTLPASSDTYSHSSLHSEYYSITQVSQTLKGDEKQFWVRGNLSYRAKFQWNFDLGKENLVPVSGEFELSEFRVINVLLYHLPGMLSSESGVRGWAGGGMHTKRPCSWTQPWTSLWTRSMDYPCEPPLIFDDEFYQRSKWILVNCSQFILSGLLSFSFTHPFKFFEFHTWIRFSLVHMKE